jgi:hypothetical protein
MGEWASKEIQLLKQYYLENKPLKQIGTLLGRSMSSVNKSLTRFKIRQHRPLKARVLLDLTRGTQLPLDWYIHPPCDMKEVHAFVESHMRRRLKFEDGQWTYYGFSIEQRRAFVLINLEREQRHLPIFYLNYDS